MSKFGNLKLRLLSKLTESFASNNKKEVRNILKSLKSDKVLAEMYLFYEDLENKTISNKETATLFVEQVEKLLTERFSLIGNQCDKLSSMVGEIDVPSNELYECLDVLSEQNTLMNIESKVSAKQKLISHLMSNKTSTIEENEDYTENENLLNTVLVNNFNTKFSDFMNENEKETFKKIVSMSNEDLQTQMVELKENLINKIEGMISENSDAELVNKLTDVKKQVVESNTNKYDYYRMLNLSEGFED